MSLRQWTEKIIGKSIYDGLDITKGLLEGTVEFGFELSTNFQLLCLLFGIGEGIIFSRDLLVQAGSIVAVFAEIFMFILFMLIVI